MNYTPLGNTNLRPSTLGFGASPLGNEFGTTDAATGVKAVHHAIEHGINYFDVAPYYGTGLAEERLGNALKGYRDRVILATKVGRYGKNNFDFSAKRIRQSLELSLKRLHTDHIDLLQVHDIEFGDAEQIIHETLPEMLAFKQEGLINFVGITGYPLHILKRVAQAVPDIDVVLSYCRYNLLDTSMNDVLLPLIKANNYGLINASPLHMRMLSNEGAPDWHPAPAKVNEVTQKAAAYCREQGASLSKLAVQFALQHPNVATTLVGMSSPELVDLNLQALNDPIDTELLKAVQTILAPVKNTVWISGQPENNDPGAVVGNA